MSDTAQGRLRSANNQCEQNVMVVPYYNKYNINVMFLFGFIWIFVENLTSTKIMLSSKQP